MDLGLTGKVVAVAAASKGIGKAIAFRLAEEGALLGVCSRDLASIQRTADEIQSQTGAQVLAIEADLTQAAAAENFVNTTAEKFGGLDALVCNAGGPPAGTFADFDDTAWDAAFQLTLMSVVRLCRTAIPHFQNRGGGRVVNVSSFSVKQPVDNLILSNSIRMSAIGLFKSLSNEYGADNITFNTVCPGFTQTERLEQLFQHRAETLNVPSDTLKNQAAETVSMKRLGDPQELADLAALLCSNCSRYITGTAIQVDGGATKGYV